MDIFLGSVMSFGFDFAPKGWALCSGQLVSIQQNTALFSLLGTNYGGNGIQTFGLPDLRGRLPMSQGNGAGLSPRVIGEFSGQENVTMLVTNLPSHTHAATFTPSGGSSPVTVKASSAVPPSSPAYTTAPSTSNNVLAASPIGTGFAAQIWAPSSVTPDITIAGVSGGGGGGGTVNNASTGNSLPLPIINPFLVLNFSIALQGIFPSRN